MAIFLLRGLVREKAHWGNFPELLQKALSHTTVVTPEILGVGEYVDTPSSDNFEAMVDFMRDKYFLNVKDNGPHYILAMSLGGMIARCWAEKYPNDFKGLILANTSFKGINPLFSRLKPKALLTFLKIFFTASVEKRENIIVNMVSNEPTHKENTISKWVEIQKERPVKRISFINQIKAALSYNPPKKKPVPKLLWLASKGDRLCNYKSTLALQELWGGDIALHESAGHDIPLDDAPWMIEKIQNFIKEV